LSRRATCCTSVAPAIGWAVYCRLAFCSGGDGPGLASYSTAAAPATAGAADEVPLICITVSS
jgi:hypothetical protein